MLDRDGKSSLSRGHETDAAPELNKSQAEKCDTIRSRPVSNIYDCFCGEEDNVPLKKKETHRVRPEGTTSQEVSIPPSNA